MHIAGLEDILDCSSGKPQDDQWSFYSYQLYLRPGLLQLSCKCAIMAKYDRIKFNPAILYNPAVKALVLIAHLRNLEWHCLRAMLWSDTHIHVLTWFENMQGSKTLRPAGSALDRGVAYTHLQIHQDPANQSGQHPITWRGSCQKEMASQAMCSATQKLISTSNSRATRRRKFQGKKEPRNQRKKLRIECVQGHQPTEPSAVPSGGGVLVVAMWCAVMSSDLASRWGEIRWLVARCHVVRRDVMWWDVMSWCHVVWCCIMPCDVTGCDVVPCDVVSCHFMRRHVMRTWCDVTWCDTMWCDVMWCDDALGPDAVRPDGMQLDRMWCYVVVMQFVCAIWVLHEVVLCDATWLCDMVWEDDAL